MTPIVDVHPDGLVHMLAALAAGAAIGIERSYHGRPAGFRTHALVCLASAVLMQLTIYQPAWFHGGAEVVRIDPQRMAQGIMTGIGFLGAGVIFKEGLTVRGLTTAASIWITASIGVLMGAGLFTPATIATLLALGVLAAFRWIEARIPTQQYAQHRIRFGRDDVMPEDALRDLLANHRCSLSGLSYQLADDGRFFEYRMMLRTNNAQNFTRLSRSLAALPMVREFQVSPSMD
jgi:putative Mg2+ transporter-C (MgtC) family protein